MNLAGKAVWITGASSGIGKELAIQLAQKGAKLVLSARNEEALHELANRLGPTQHHVLPLDLSQSDEFANTVAPHLAQIGDIDVLINNGGVSQRGLFIASDLSAYRQLMEVNYFGTVALTKLVIEQMVTRKSGMIVSVSSVAGKVGSKFRSGYSGSKYAVVGFMDCLRAEVAQYNVKCLTLCPGSIKTRIAHNSLNEQGVAQNKAEESIENGMPVEQAVSAMIKAIEREKQEVVIGKGLSYWAPTIKRFLPTLFNRLSANTNYR